MPSRQVVAKELAEILKVIAHPDRIRLIEELRAGEMDVNSLAKALELPGPRVSQHLSLLRAHRLVAERRDGRRHVYQLTQSDLAAWIVGGVDFLEGRDGDAVRSRLREARLLWSGEEPNSGNSNGAAEP